MKKDRKYYPGVKGHDPNINGTFYAEVAFIAVVMVALILWVLW